VLRRVCAKDLINLKSLPPVSKIKEYFEKEQSQSEHSQKNKNRQSGLQDRYSSEP